MFEGHDTTSAAVSWCLFLLGGNPKIQDKVFQEIDTVMGGDRCRAPTMKELGEMKYLECCIKEALRLYPRFVGQYLRGETNNFFSFIFIFTVSLYSVYQLLDDAYLKMSK
jgi:cytochrome P450